MIIRCIFNSGKDLPLNNRCFGETEETDYSFLEINREYVVYGLMHISCRVDYLICLSNGPIWVPADLFHVVNNRLPLQTSLCITYMSEDYKVLYDSFNINSIIGYPELVASISHYIGIIEREPEELKKFFFEKKIIDENELL